MRVEEFSTGYYVAEMYVESGGDVPRVNDEDYRELQYEVHEAGSGEQDIVFQLDEQLFVVEPSRDIPTDVVALPEGIIENTFIKHPPALRQLRVPKPWFFEFLKEPKLV